MSNGAIGYHAPITLERDKTEAEAGRLATQRAGKRILPDRHPNSLTCPLRDKDRPNLPLQACMLDHLERHGDVGNLARNASLRFDVKPAGSNPGHACAMVRPTYPSGASRQALSARPADRLRMQGSMACSQAA